MIPKKNFIQKQFFIGDASLFSQGKGWFLGHFMHEPLLKTNAVEIAWQDISNKKPDRSDKHFHKKSLEINLVIKGKMKIKIEGKYYYPKQGQFYIIYPYTVIEEVEAYDDTQLIVIRVPSRINDKFTPYA